MTAFAIHGRDRIRGIGSRRQVERTRLRRITLLGSVVLFAAGCGAEGRNAPLRVSGHIEVTEVRLSTKVGGILNSLAKDEGEPTAAGETLARLDTVDTSLQLAAARADRDQAAADLDLRRSGFRAEEIAQASAQVAHAQADLDGAETDLKRMQQLLDEGSTTVKARDDARTRRDLAAASLRSAQEQWKWRRAGNRPDEIESARARLASAQARVDQLTQKVKDATIASPVAGVITEKLVEQGELLNPGQGICVVAELAHPWLEAYLGEPELGRVRLGQEVEVVTDGGEKRTGRISFISDQAEFTPKNVQTRDERVKLVYKIKVTLENADGLFKAGMPAEAVIRPGAARS